MTEDKRIYEKKKRNLKDRCNICGKVSDLTWDHVPPKFCFNNIRVEYNSILEISQNVIINCWGENMTKNIKSW